MMIEGWMISLLIAIIGSIASVAITRQKVDRLQSDLTEHIVVSKDLWDKDVLKRDEGFKELGSLAEKITILERDSANLLDIKTAEAKFVTRIEMKLHLEKIEIVTQNIDSKVGAIEGKQDTILDILHTLQRDSK